MRIMVTGVKLAALLVMAAAVLPFAAGSMWLEGRRLDRLDHPRPQTPRRRVRIVRRSRRLWHR